MGKIKLINNEKEFITCREDKVLLYCARKNVNLDIKDKILSLIQDDFNWGYLVKIASRHRLIPLLYFNLNSICPEMIPEDILNQLNNKFTNNVHRNLLLTRELIKILKLLKAKNIDAVPYKGPLLASLAYGNIAFRQFDDIDIFINESDIIAARDILISNGYTLDLNNISNYKFLKSQREYKFKSEEDQISIEIQWKVYGVPFYLQDYQNYLNSSRNLERIKVTNSTFLSFNAEILILILSLHNAGHQWQYLMWICDLAEIIQGYKLNWNKIITISEKLGIKRILLINLMLTIDLFDVEFPEEIWGEINDDKNVKELSILIKSKLFKEFKEPNLILHSILQVKMRESLKNGIIDLLLHIFAPTPNELKIIPLPDKLFFLYYILRPFYLIKNYDLF